MRSTPTTVVPGLELMTAAFGMSSVKCQLVTISNCCQCNAELVRLAVMVTLSSEVGS
jgi:hypothetical protein